MSLQGLDFTIEACLERWTEWHHFVSDGDSDSCCETYELHDPLLLKIIKYGYVDIELALPLSDYPCFDDCINSSPIHYSHADEQCAPE